MKRVLLAGSIFAAPFLAHAQPSTACGPSGTAECFQRPVNLLNGMLMNGQNAYRASNAYAEPALSVGPFAGASLPAGAQFWFSLGPYAFESAQTQLSESMAIGPGAGISITTGGGLFEGISAGASMTTQVNNVAIGGDAMRNYWDKSGGLAIGMGALEDGVGANNVGIGNLAMMGAYATITVNGKPMAGDQLKLAITSANACANATSRNCTIGTPIIGNLHCASRRHARFGDNRSYTSNQCDEGQLPSRRWYRTKLAQSVSDWRSAGGWTSEHRQDAYTRELATLFRLFVHGSWLWWRECDGQAGLHRLG